MIAPQSESGLNWNDWYLGCRPARRCTYGNVDDAVEELGEPGVAELDLEVDFIVELDVMVTPAEEGGCVSPINASALILLGQQVELSGHLGYELARSIDKVEDLFRGLVHVLTMQKEREDATRPSRR